MSTAIQTTSRATTTDTVPIVSPKPVRAVASTLATSSLSKAIEKPWSLVPATPPKRRLEREEDLYVKASALAARAEQLVMQGQIAESLAVAQQAHALGSTHLPLLSRIFRAQSLAFYEMEEYPAAIQMAQKALNLKGAAPLSASVEASCHLLIGNCHWMEYEDDKALAAFRIASEIPNPDQRQVIVSLDRLADAYIELEDLDQAAAPLTRAAYLAYQVGEMRTTIVLARKAVTCPADSNTEVNLWNLLGAAHYNLGELLEAEEAFRQSVLRADNAQDQYPAVYNWGLVLIRLGRPAKALRRMTWCCERNRSDPALWQYRALTLTSLGQYQEALNCLTQATVISWDDSSVLASIHDQWTDIMKEME